jgi:oligoribonuclease NrnB/cAMP/cGMP phosphodiesterase (DHH superfamily)
MQNLECPPPILPKKEKRVDALTEFNNFKVIKEKEINNKVPQKQTREITDTKKEVINKEVINIEGSIPKDTLKKFNATEILKHSRERLAKYLKNVDLRTLIGYIESGGINLKRVAGIPTEWEERIKKIKQLKNNFIMINPKLYFLSKHKCAEIALEELRARIIENKREN